MIHQALVKWNYNFSIVVLLNEHSLCSMKLAHQALEGRALDELVDGINKGGCLPEIKACQLDKLL